MADILEDLSSAECTDRAVDSNDFLNSQFEIFTHDYREKKEVPQCSAHEGGSGCCGDSAEDAPQHKKKDVVNVTRRLQKAILGLKSMKGSEVIADLTNKLSEINAEIIQLVKNQSSEFSTTSLKLPDYDTVDMELFFGDGEVLQQPTMLESVALQEAESRLRMTSLMAEADIVLNEYEHIKHGLRP